MLSQSQSMMISIVLLNLLGQLSPGPDVLMISKTALTYSRWAAFKVVLGIFSGVVFWLLLTIQGYSTLMRHLPWLQYAFMLLGGAYLLYNGWRMLHAPLPSGQAQMPLPPRHFYLAGLVTNLSNPKIVLYFGSVMSVALADVTNATLKYEIMLVLLIQIFLTFCLMLWLFSLPAMKRRYLQFSAVIDKVAGCLFIGFGGWLYWQVAKSWLRGG